MENGMFLSEIASGFGESGGTPLPRIPRRNEQMQGSTPKDQLFTFGRV